MPNTQEKVQPRQDRPLSNASQVVEAHGVTQTQDHDYNEDATPGHITGEYEHKGEDVKRTEKASKATAGRHITSGKNGLQVAAERKASNETARTEHQKSWQSNKLTVCPEKRKK